MANHIHSLTAANASLRAEVTALREGMRGLMAHMQGSKFHGADNAWIATADVNRWLLAIEAAGTSASDGEG